MSGSAPIPIPAAVFTLEPPITIQFLIVQLVTPFKGLATVLNHTTAEKDAAFVF